MSVYELYERKITNQQLFTVLANIPDKQAIHIYFHIFQGMKQVCHRIKPKVSAGWPSFFYPARTSDAGERIEETFGLGIYNCLCFVMAYGRIFIGVIQKQG
jgi:hypothetical protein